MPRPGRHRARIGGLVVLAAVSVACAHGADDVPKCDRLPKVLRLAQPPYPPNIEPRGLPSPVSMTIEFTVTPDGRATQMMVVESNATSYLHEFSEQALRAMSTMRFERVAAACRGRMKIVFK